MLLNVKIEFEIASPITARFDSKPSVDLPIKPTLFSPQKVIASKPILASAPEIVII